MKWTEKQAEAIELRNKNMLVAAAAGSGKTAVLVERIKQLIISEGVSVNEMLVVTFTNAAAAEMREKIVQAVTSEIEKNSEDTVFLRRQLNLIYKANISTFHAFALEVIRRFFHIIEIDPNFKICDEAQQIILQAQAMDNLFEELFHEGSFEFIELLNNYASSKNENTVKEMILEIYKTIQSVPEPWNWLDSSVENLAMDETNFLQSEVFEQIKLHIKKELLYARTNYDKSIEIFENAGAIKFALKCRDDLVLIDDAITIFESGNFTQFSDCISKISYTRMVTTKDEKAAFDEVKEFAGVYRERCKDALKGIKQDYFIRPLREQIEDMNKVYPHARTLAMLVKQFSEYYKREKEEKRLIDFNDIEHYALKILENEQAASEYREKFKYIFIDEYQDSNVIQDTLIAAIKRENNLFMVGDVKQSIYKFRLAEPEIFMEKYKEFKKEENKVDAKIDLNFNFRSKGNVINAVNKIFSSLMEGYDADAALYKGIPYEGEFDYLAELHVVDQKIAEDMEVDEEIKELKSAEMEAFIAGKIIKDALGKTIFDAKKNVERPMTKQDIVILMRGQKNYADKFQQILMQMDIPTHVNDSDGYFDTLEIQIFVNLLRIIDNRRQDIPFISVLHSSIFGFTVEELALIRCNSKNTSYFEAFYRYAVVLSETNSKLCRKCVAVLEKLAEWKQISEFMPLDELIWKLLWDTGYYTFTGALPGGTQRQANLRALIDKAVQYQSSQMKGLFGFITYVDAIKDKKVPMGQVTLVGENDDVVRIMTIHKSKGLEFPMVIVAGMGRRFNNANSRKPVDLHKNIGLGLRYVDRQRHFYKKTLVQMAIDNKRKQEDMEEEIRILYVAFTRAQDKLILLGSVKDLERFRETKESLEEPDLFRASCYLDLIMPVISDSNISVHYHDAQEISFDNTQMNEGKEQLRKLFKDLNQNGNQMNESGALYAQIDKQLSFTYGYEYARLLKSKFSVSKLNKISDLLSEGGMTPENYERLYYESSYDTALAVPQFSQSKKSGFTASERGTIMHSVLEHWDFKQGYLLCSNEQSKALEHVRSFISSLEHRQLLTPEEGDEARKHAQMIVTFQCSDLGRRLAQADEILKETPFNLMKKIKGEDIIVQGIIDCYFREGDKYILLDYKTNRVNNPEDQDEIAYLKETYREQIALYREAIEVVKNVKVSDSYIYLMNAGVIIGYE